MTKIAKEIWDYLLSEEIMITAEYLPEEFNVLADKEPRNVKDSSEWKLEPQSFQRIIPARIIPALGNPEIDLIASRVSVQIPCYMAWEMDPFSYGRDAFQIRWNIGLTYAFLLP